jgi:microcystin-dependent protein
MAIKVSGTEIVSNARALTNITSATINGNITVTGTVDGRDIAADGITLDGLPAAYQSYTDTAIANLVDTAPTTLDTLNELAAALGDDPNFATTVTNSIATKLSLSGGTMTGDITFNSTQLFDGRDVSADGAVIDSLGTAATQNVGTAAGNVVQLDGSARLPAVDGSQLTGIEGVPSGVIAMWSGSIASIPSGWVLCDGLNSTPDLRDRFIVGAGNTYAVADTGGADSVTLAETNLPSHTHSVSGTTASDGAHTHNVSGNTSNTGAHSHSGSTSNTGSHGHNLNTSGAYRVAFPGSSNTYNAGAEGTGRGGTIASAISAGAHSHNFNTSNTGAHSHTLSGTADSAGAHTHSFSTTSGATGGGTAHENRPPYYALAYIMKT